MAKPTRLWFEMLKRLWQWFVCLDEMKIYRSSWGMMKLGVVLTGLLLADGAIAQAPPRRGPLDRDGDGKISRAEFPGPREMFDRFDTDKDGFLNTKEREALRASRRQGVVGRGFAPQQFFRELDEDRNRQLSAKEWGLLFKAADFKVADTDKDGQVSSREWFRYLGMGNRLGGGRQRPERGPAPGDAAPKVTAKSMAGDKPVDLSRVTRPTVLIFGSYT